MEILVPWIECSDSSLVDELRREIGEGHVLEGIELSIVARRQDRDDFLYAFNDESGRVAVVHLTWRKTRETNPKWPRTRILESMEVWSEYMLAAHSAFAEADPDGAFSLKEEDLWTSGETVDYTRIEKLYRDKLRGH